MKIQSQLLVMILGLTLATNARCQVSPLKLDIDGSPLKGKKDLTHYALGQGGLSSQPMIDAHLPQLQQLHPKTIRFFIQEYYGIYPAKGQYNWEKLDRMFSAIVATGAHPIADICFKPAVLFPVVDQSVCQPEDYAQWDELVFRLVRHCQEKNFGVEYWEIGNEVDIGEDGGCPYRFDPSAYLNYYRHTAEAIRRADPKARVGGPALAYFRDPIGDSLIAFCGRGDAPLDFFSWHGYSNNPEFFRQSIDSIKAKLARYPSLKNTETMITEWNMDLGNPRLKPGFQPAFILETTRIFRDAGLDRSAYYHIRDFFVDPNEFRPFFSEKGTEFMSHWWNVMPQYSGIYDNQGRVRPSYFVFHWLSLMDGEQLNVTGENKDVKALAVRHDQRMNILVWNFPTGGQGKKYEGVLTLPPMKEGTFRLVRLDPERAVNNVIVLRSGTVRELDKKPLTLSLSPDDIEWIEINP